MKIFILTDLEGASGVYTFAQTRGSQNPSFPKLNREAKEYLMGDIAAVVKGLKEVGVKDIIVLDGHGVIPHLMVSGARYLTGAAVPYQKSGLDATCDGLIMLGYHAMCGTEDGVLNHTQSSVSERRYWYHGVESGELAQDALYAGQFGVPPIMVSGDEATCREARKFFGKHCVAVTVKKGIHREAALLYPLEETQQSLYKGAKQAIASIHRCKPYKLRMPINVKTQYYAVEKYPSQTRLVTKEEKVNDISDRLNILLF